MYGDVKQKVVQAHIDHPEWTAGDIALNTRIHPATVRKIVNLTGIRPRSEAAKRLSESIGRRDPNYRIPYAGSPKHDEPND
jgi:hypothetical protein